MEEDDDEEGDEDRVARDDEGDAQKDGVEDDPRFEDEDGHRVVRVHGGAGLGVVVVA